MTLLKELEERAMGPFPYAALVYITNSYRNGTITIIENGRKRKNQLHRALTFCWLDILHTIKEHILHLCVGT
jgi:hypothetical protein